MHPFPVEYSSLSTAALLDLVKANYTISSIASISFIKRGFNDTYLVTAGENKWVLRVYKHNWRKREDIEAEVTLLLYLKENNVSVSVPIISTQNTTIHAVEAPEGIRYCVLFSYAAGDRVKKLSVEQARLLGIETARMHLLTKDKVLKAVPHDYTIANQFALITAQLRTLLVAYPKQLAVVLELEQLFIEKEKQNSTEGIGVGICHGDLQSENFHLSIENEFTFFDFDFFGKGYLIYDIGVFMWYDHKNKPAAIMNAFLEGYESIRPLSQTERDFIPWLSTLRALFQITLYCKISDGKQLPLWPTQQIAEFIDKVEKWQNEKT